MTDPTPTVDDLPADELLHRIADYFRVDELRPDIDEGRAEFVALCEAGAAACFLWRHRQSSPEADRAVVEALIAFARAGWSDLLLEAGPTS